MAIKVLDLELSIPMADVVLPAGYQTVWFLARLHGYPLGYVKLTGKTERVGRAELQQALVEQIGGSLLTYLSADLLCQQGLKPAEWSQFQAALAAPRQPNHHNYPEPTPMISVAICTGDNTTKLTECLESLAALDYPNFEVLVIDNAPKTGQTTRVVQNWPQNNPLAARLRYVVEPNMGLSWARNRAISAASGEIIAYTDANAVVDKGWLAALARAFANPAVGCVTGLVVPLELDEAQAQLETDGGFERGFVAKYYHSGNLPHPAYPFYAAIFGTGANMAFRRAIFAKIGQFDTFLGTGTATGGDEHALFYKLLNHGYGLVYEPSVLVRYHYPASDLTAQYAEVGRATMARLVQHYMNYPAERAKVRFLLRWWFLEHGLWRFLQAGRRTNFPRQLVISEMRGSLGGVSAYFRARNRAQRLTGSNWEEGKRGN